MRGSDLHDERCDAEALLSEYRETGDRRVRNRVVEEHRWLAVAISKRMQTGSEPLDDLVQVAMVGLVKAADRFDPAFGVAFRPYAALTVQGELRRHYRDATWSMRVPRRLQELRYEIRAATEVLHERLGRSPSTAELAAYLLVTTDEVLDAMCADSNFRARSLDQMLAVGGHDVADPLDAGFAGIDAGDSFEDLVACLSPRLRAIVEMRFVEQLRQREIAARLGVSQVQISRLLRQALRQIRAARSADDRVGATAIAS